MSLSAGPDSDEKDRQPQYRPHPSSLPATILPSAQHPPLTTMATSTSRPRRPEPSIASRPFAGRIGGNQEFIVSQTDPDEAHLLKQTPDAAPFVHWRDSFNLHQFADVELWKAALIEGWAMCMLTFLTVVIAIGLGPLVNKLSTGALIPSIVGGISNAILLPLFIYSAGPVSGGHINPTITVATFFTRLSTFPRMVLYVVFQTAGAAVGGGFVHAALGTKDFTVAGCFIDTSLVPVGDAFAIEFTTTMTLIFLSFGVGLDPRQQKVFGPALAPGLVGLILGVCTFGTGFVRPGYSGVSANPARCFGAFVGSNFPTYHWLHWVGPFSAAAVHGFFYYVCPPYFHRKAIDD